MDTTTKLDPAAKSTCPNRLFDEIDYSIFIFMLAISAFTGIYFAYYSKKKPNTTSEYLIGDRKIGLFPVTLSLASSCIATTKYLATSTSIYQYGTQLLLSPVAVISACLCSGTIFIPVLYKLNMISSFQYFKKRFNSTIGTFASLLFVLKMLLWSAKHIYGPSIALAQVSGIDAKILIPCVSIVCIFYTCIGGLRAVAWADTIQMIIMIVGAFSIMILGTYKVGGIENVWKINEQAGRIIFFQMDFDPTVRYTFWDVTIGWFFGFLAHIMINQSMTQRCLSLPSFKKAQIAIMIFCIINIMLTLVNGISALAAYTKFHDCDPIKTKMVSRDDQIMPYFMMSIAENIPAIPGIYLSAIFSASLSSVSTGLNSLAGVVLMDFIRPLWKKPIPEAKEALLMKIIVFISGIIFVALMYLVDYMGSLFQTMMSLSSIAQGPLLGVFVLGVLFPWANSKGALIGGITAISFIVWLTIGSQMNKKRINTFKSALSIDGCDNSTLINYYKYANKTAIAPLVHQNEVFPLYKVPYLYYTLIAVLIVVIVGLIVSFLTGPNNPKDMDSNLFPAIVRKLCGLKSEKRPKENVELMNKDSE